MDSLTTAQNLIEEFSLLHKLPLALSDKGDCAVFLNANIHVTLCLDSGKQALLLHAPVGVIEQRDSLKTCELFREILEANYLWDDSNGYTLSLAADILTAQQLVSLHGLTAALLSEYLTQIAATVEQWRTRIGVSSAELNHIEHNPLNRLPEQSRFSMLSV